MPTNIFGRKKFGEKIGKKTKELKTPNSLKQEFLNKLAQVNHSADSPLQPAKVKIVKPPTKIVLTNNSYLMNKDRLSAVERKIAARSQEISSILFESCFVEVIATNRALEDVAIHARDGLKMSDLHLDTRILESVSNLQALQALLSITSDKDVRKAIIATYVPKLLVTQGSPVPVEEITTKVGFLPKKKEE